MPRILESIANGLCEQRLDSLPGATPLELAAFETLNVPRFARLDDYAGIWAIEPRYGRSLLARAKSIDLAAHVRQGSDRRADGDEPNRRTEYQTVSAGSNQKIAIVPLSGPLMKAVSSMDAGTSTVYTRRLIRKAAADPDVAAILLAIDSPGGTVSGTADLGADIAAADAKKPVFAFVQDLCASAAFWCGSQAAKIYVNDKTALVGSIGTLLVVYDQSELAAEMGIKTLVFGTGPIKGAGVAGAPVTEEQQAYFRNLVNETQIHFDAAVRRGRGLTSAQLEKAKSGGCYSAEEAVRLGLADGIRTMESVLDELAVEARRRSRADKSRTSTADPAATPASHRTTQPIQRSSAMNEQTPIDLGANVPAETTATAMEVSLRQGEVVTLPLGSTAGAGDREAAARDMERIAGIRRVTVGQESIGAQAIREGWSIEKAELAAMKASLPNVRAANPASVAPLIDRSRDRNCTHDVLSAALLLRSGIRLDNRAFGSGRGNLPSWLQAGINDPYRNQVMDAGHRYSTLSLLDLCRESIRLDGRDCPLSQDEIIRTAFSGGSLSNIFTTNVNAVLLAGYMEHPDTTVGWTREGEVPNFKSNERPRMKTEAGLTKLPRGGTADDMEVSDTAESYKIARYSGKLAVDEQDIIDDDLSAFARVAADMAVKAARLRPDLVYAILLANGLLADGLALFATGTGRGNLGSSSALASGTLKTAISAMMILQENGVNVAIEPTHLIVPPSLKWTAYELVNSTGIVVAGTAGTVTERGNFNALQNAVTPVAEARLENGVIDPDSGETYGGSATSWYLASVMAPTVEVGYRRGTGKAPSVRSYPLTNGKFGIGWDVTLDIGAKALDWRGLRKTTA